MDLETNGGAHIDATTQGLHFNPQKHILSRTKDIIFHNELKIMLIYYRAHFIAGLASDQQ